MIRMLNVFKVTGWLTQKILDGFAGDEWRHMPEGSNHALWILGHIHDSRRYLARVIGLDLPQEDWEHHFDMGTKPEDVPEEITGPDMLAGFMKTHEEFIGYLGELDPSVLDEEIKDRFPEMPQTKLGALQFMQLHESFHVGQLATIRKALGKTSWMADMTGE
jgi:uncharacterized damage-inducible protein DinB